MGVRKYYEVSCDQCNCGEHFPLGLDWKVQARNYGWVLSKLGDFCTKDCFKRFKDSIQKPENE